MAGAKPASRLHAPPLSEQQADYYGRRGGTTRVLKGFAVLYPHPALKLTRADINVLASCFATAIVSLCCHLISLKSRKKKARGITSKFGGPR